MLSHNENTIIVKMKENLLIVPKKTVAFLD
jgi:hypothetical protein